MDDRPHKVRKILHLEGKAATSRARTSGVGAHRPGEAPGRAVRAASEGAQGDADAAELSSCGARGAACDGAGSAEDQRRRPARGRAPRLPALRRPLEALTMELPLGLGSRTVRRRVRVRAERRAAEAARASPRRPERVRDAARPVRHRPAPRGGLVRELRRQRGDRGGGRGVPRLRRGVPAGRPGAEPGRPAGHRQDASRRGHHARADRAGRLGRDRQRADAPARVPRHVQQRPAVALRRDAGAARRCEHLVLDDLGRERQTEWVQETLYLVVNARYQECLATSITTNLDRRAAARLGEPILDRLAETNHAYWCQWPSHRRRPTP